jgi:glycosyltransferase involved in cell wall biosynthesis
MKILMVSEDVPHRSMGGLGRHAVTLAQRFAQDGHEVDFMGNNFVPYEEVRSEITLPGQFFPELNMKNIGWKEVKMGIYNPLRRPFIALRFARAIMRRARDYDVVHYHGHFPLLANFIPRNINFVQTRHDQGSDCLAHIRFRNHDVCRETSHFSCATCATPDPNALQRWVSAGAVLLYRKLVAKAFLRHKAIFVSDMLRRNFSRTAGKVYWGTVVHNFVDYEGLRGYVSAQSGNPKLIEVFIAGKLYEPKGIIAFLEHINGKIPPQMRITIAGDGENEDELRALYGCDRVVLLGWQAYSETMRKMSAAGVVVIPSICEESCATTILESMALGKRTFALSLGGTPELVKYQQYQSQMSLFDTMSDLVETLVSIDTNNLYHSALSNVFNADISIIREEILKIYLESTNRCSP